MTSKYMDLVKPNPAVHSQHHHHPVSLQALLETVVIAIFVITFIVQAFQIPSESMEKTLLIGDYLLVDKLHFGEAGYSSRLLPYRKVQRGDIVVFHYPVNPSQHFVKRVIGVPGDHLKLINKRVFVNGNALDEPYARFISPRRDPFRDDFPRLDTTLPYGLDSRWWLQMHVLTVDGQLIVPDGYYFVMGDNRDDSDDSRYWGFVPRENIVGRPILIYWSLRTDQAGGSENSVAGKLERIAYYATHIFALTRWDRTLHLVY